MNYSEEKVMEAFRIFAALARDGETDKVFKRKYYEDDELRNLVDLFAREVQTVVFPVSYGLIMTPKTDGSNFHISNQALKNEIFGTNSTNIDLYTAYLAIIILVGEFYNSYETNSKTRAFIPLGEWASKMNEMVDSLSDFDENSLREIDRTQEYNWYTIKEYWLALDEIREDTQDIKAKSRINFLRKIADFLKKKDLLEDLGESEYDLTEKMEAIVENYYMDYEYNRGLIDFLYGMRNKNGEDFQD